MALQRNAKSFGRRGAMRFPHGCRGGAAFVLPLATMRSPNAPRSACDIQMGMGALWSSRYLHATTPGRHCRGKCVSRLEGERGKFGTLVAARLALPCPRGSDAKTRPKRGQNEAPRSDSGPLLSGKKLKGLAVFFLDGFGFVLASFWPRPGFVLACAFSDRSAWSSVCNRGTGPICASRHEASCWTDSGASLAGIR
ncbi:unnamed protein product [Amoebophrya sp. A120]|nr:unnamed protein product [Amoebophrya sp. A120]|eukprot:GSA120T00006936001.1